MKILIGLAVLLSVALLINPVSAERNRPPSERAMLGRSESDYLSQQDRQAALLRTTMASVQRALREREGMENVRINGIYDRATRNALAGYQRREGLTITGKADIETLRSLDIDPWE